MKEWQNLAFMFLLCKGLRGSVAICHCQGWRLGRMYREQQVCGAQECGMDRQGLPESFTLKHEKQGGKWLMFLRRDDV
jgi:hypothetical protein